MSSSQKILLSSLLEVLFTAALCIGWILSNIGLPPLQAHASLNKMLMLGVALLMFAFLMLVRGTLLQELMPSNLKAANFLYFSKAFALASITVGLSYLVGTAMIG